MQSELEWPKSLSHRLPFAVDSSTSFRSSSSSIKCLSLSSDTWKTIFQLLRILLHLFFLLKFYNNLHRKVGKRLNFFISLLTMSWRCHFWLLGQSQNSMRLLLPFLRNSLSSCEIEADCVWYRYDDELKIPLAVWMKSVIMKIQFTLGRQVAWLILHLIVKSSALVDVTFTTWHIVLMTRLSWL